MGTGEIREETRRKREELTLKFFTSSFFFRVFIFFLLLNLSLFVFFPSHLSLTCFFGLFQLTTRLLWPLVLASSGPVILSLFFFPEINYLFPPRFCNYFFFHYSERERESIRLLMKTRGVRGNTKRSGFLFSL